MEIVHIYKIIDIIKRIIDEIRQLSTILQVSNSEV